MSYNTVSPEVVAGVERSQQLFQETVVGMGIKTGLETAAAPWRFAETSSPLGCFAETSSPLGCFAETSSP